MSINLGSGSPPLFLGVPLITKASFNPPSGTNGPTSSDAQLAALFYRTYQIDPLNIVSASGLASLGSPISASAPFIVGSLLINTKFDTLILLNTNIQKFKIQGSTNWGGGSPTWTTLADYSSAGLAAADLILVLGAAVNYNALQIVIYS